jgi:cytochrome c oxidase subunit 3
MSTISKESNVWGGGSKPFDASYGKMMMWFFLLTDALTFSGFLGAYGFCRFKYSESWPLAEHVFTHFPGIKGDQPLLYVALMTFILIMSSVTMVLAVHHGKLMNKNKVAIWMFLTIIGGAIFLGSQAWEWMHFIHGTHDGSIQLADGSVAKVINSGEKIMGKTYDYEILRIGAEKYITEKDLISNLKENSKKIYGANMIVNEYGLPQFANFFFFITGFHGFHVFSGVILNIIIFINILFGTYERRGHYEMVEKVGLYWHFVDLVWVFVFTFFYLI